MTVTNPVSRYFARWAMRVSGAGELLRIVYFGGIFLTTGVSALREYGHGSYAWPFVLVTGAGTLAFAYLYTEYGVWNQQQRDRRDKSTNFASPDQRIDDEMIGSAVFGAIHGRPPSDDEQETIAAAVDKPYTTYRDGIDVNGTTQQEEDTKA